MIVALKRVVTLLAAVALWATVGTSYALEEVTYYHNDALGSPIVATDSSGAPKWHEEYDPYGGRELYESRELACGNGICYADISLGDEKQWFTGQLEETEFGLLYYGARWYMPEVGRFLSPDPVTFSEANVFSFNRFAYADNNPYRYTDPDGESPIDVVFLAIDVSRLAIAVSAGDAAAAQSAAVDVAFSAVGVASPVPGLGQALKVVRGADKAGDLARAVSAGKSAAKSAENATNNSGVETVQRWMSRDELKATQETGLLRGGRAGTHHVTDAANSDPLRARQRSALESTPEVRATLEVPSGTFSAPSQVNPNFNMPGGGMERTATGNVPVRIKRVD